MWYLKSGPETGHHFLRVRGADLGPRSCPLALQARALWRWSNYLQHLDLREKTQVLINVDETSVRLIPEEVKAT